MDMKLEVLVLPVSDVDRAKRFYERLQRRFFVPQPALKFRLTADVSLR